MFELVQEVSFVGSYCSLLVSVAVANPEINANQQVLILGETKL